MMHRIETPFGFSSTADEVVAGIDLSGKWAMVTGSSSGIGIETARVLAAAGAEVTLAVRHTDAGARVAADITASTGNDRVRVARLDLVDRTSIARFVSAWNGPLHILVNNAGGILPTLERTAEGSTTLLRPLVKRGSSPSVRPGTSIHPSFSTTSTSATAPM